MGAEAEAEFEVPVVAPDGVKDLLDRGYTIVDIRSPQEVAETGSKRIWEDPPGRHDGGGPRDEPPVAPADEGQVPQQDEPHPPGLRRRHRAHGDRRGLLERRG